MQSKINVAFAHRRGLVFGLILILLQSSCTLPEQQQRSLAGPPPEPDSWDADFLVPGLNQSYSLTADINRCIASLPGSTPHSVEMKQVIDVPLGDRATLLVYAGWPRNDTGKITGITNRSNDTPKNCIYENKLGPTVVWLVLGCKQLCVHSIIEHYTVTVEDAGVVSYLARIEEPFLDESLTGGHCLKPNFQCKSGDEAERCAGVIDQPGSTLSTLGDGYTSLSGERSVISENNHISIDFKHRAFIECDTEILAITAWGYRLSAKLGLPAYLITPQVDDDLQFDLMLEDDPDPLNRAAFSAALAELDDLHHENNRK